MTSRPHTPALFRPALKVSICHFPKDHCEKLIGQILLQRLMVIQATLPLQDNSQDIPSQDNCRAIHNQDSSLDILSQVSNLDILPQISLDIRSPGAIHRLVAINNRDTPNQMLVPVVGQIQVIIPLDRLAVIQWVSLDLQVSKIIRLLAFLILNHFF